MRSLTYALTAPELEQMTSMQVTGTEWVAHLACIRKLAEELRPGLNGGFHPSRSIFHGMVSSQERAVTSSAGAQLIDELVEWLDERIDSDRGRTTFAARIPRRKTSPRRSRSATSCRTPPRRASTSTPEKLLWRRRASAGSWRARGAPPARRGARPSASRRRTAAYRFAVVQSELYRRHLRLVVERFDLRPLALYLRHLARWHLEADSGEHVERVVQTLLERSARGLGLEAAR